METNRRCVCVRKWPQASASVRKRTQASASAAHLPQPPPPPPAPLCRLPHPHPPPPPIQRAPRLPGHVIESACRTFVSCLRVVSCLRLRVVSLSPFLMSCLHIVSCRSWWHVSAFGFVDPIRVPGTPLPDLAVACRLFLRFGHQRLLSFLRCNYSPRTPAPPLPKLPAWVSGAVKLGCVSSTRHASPEDKGLHLTLEQQNSKPSKPPRNSQASSSRAQNHATRTCASLGGQVQRGGPGVRQRVCLSRAPPPLFFGGGFRVLQ